MKAILSILIITMSNNLFAINQWVEEPRITSVVDTSYSNNLGQEKGKWSIETSL